MSLAEPIQRYITPAQGTRQQKCTFEEGKPSSEEGEPSLIERGASGASSGQESLNSTHHLITSPGGTRGQDFQMCVNQNCNQPADKAYYNFCPSCFKSFDNCWGNPSARALKYQPSLGEQRGLKGMRTPPRDASSPPVHVVSPQPQTRGQKCANEHCKRDGVKEWHNLCRSCFTSGQHSPPVVVGVVSPVSPAEPPRNIFPANVYRHPADRYKDSLAHLESASKVGAKMCRFPKCDSYGNSRCQGYCNNCHTKLKQMGIIK